MTREPKDMSFPNFPTESPSGLLDGKFEELNPLSGGVMRDLLSCPGKPRLRSCQPGELLKSSCLGKNEAGQSETGILAVDEDESFNLSGHPTKNGRS